MAIPFPDIDPIAFSVGPLVVRWYALAYIAGFILGWRYALYLCGLTKDVRPNALDIDDFLPWGILGVILGGRVGYVLFYQLPMYMAEPLEILKVWNGGMSFHGGASGAIIAMVIYAMVKKISFLRLADIFCCGVPIGLFFGRLANFVNGELFGRTTDVAWGVVFPHGGPMPRHPSQIYEALLEGALLFVVLYLFARNDAIRNRPGIIAGTFLIGYGVSRVIVEFFREPDVQIGYIMNIFTMGQVLCVPMILAGAYVVWYALRRGLRNG